MYQREGIVQIFELALQTVTGGPEQFSESGWRSPLRFRRQRSMKTAARRISAGIHPAESKSGCHMTKASIVRKEPPKMSFYFRSHCIDALFQFFNLQILCINHFLPISSRFAVYQGCTLSHVLTY